jgi:hypothetical protein
MKYVLGLLLVCLAAIAAVVMWPAGIDLIRPFRSPDVTVQQQLEPPPEASSQAKVKPAWKPTKSRVPETHAVIEPAPTQAESAGKPTVAGDPTPAATQTEAIVKTYGDPAVSIRRVERGHDLETLVYTRNRGKDVSAISLKDGKVSSQSGVTPAMDSPAPRPAEPTAALVARPPEPQPAAIAIPQAAEAPKTIPKAPDKTLAAVPTATKPPGQASAQGNAGTCGEYRNGKLTVKPCSQVPESPGDWLAKGAGAASN